jgi:hypothetical protein
MKKIFITILLLFITALGYSQGVLKGKLIFNKTEAVAKGYQVIIVPRVQRTMNN